MRTFLEQVALGDAIPHVQADAQQALEEWWLPNARCRPTPQETAALRAVPVTYRVVVGDVYRLSVPDTFTGSGARSIPAGIAARADVGWLPLRGCAYGGGRQRDTAEGAVAGRFGSGAAHAVS